MKNNKGVTLIALVVIIVLIIIMSTLAIYTGANSLKLIQIQKYKAQMQAIQSAVDEFYEEYENTYEKNKNELNNSQLKNSSNTVIGPIYEEDFLELFIQYKNANSSDTIVEFIKNQTFSNINNYENIYQIIEENYSVGDDEDTKKLKKAQKVKEYSYESELRWWEGYYEENNKAQNDVSKSIANHYGIAYDEGHVQKQYYYLSKAEVEDILGVKNIDISDNFIINFQKRYVFSETPLNIDKKGGDSVDIYCLYELNEEEQIIEFKTDNSGGTLKIEVVEKTKNYQKIKISTLKGVETKIKQIYYEKREEAASIAETDDETKLTTVESAKNLFEEITGLGTNEVYIKIKQDGDYKFTAEDFFEGYYSNGEEYTFIKLHEPPVLEDNMIPFIAVSETEGIVYSEDTCSDINEWYDYSGNNPKKYATVVISNNEINSNNKGKKFEINQKETYINGTTHIVKVWIPKDENIKKPGYLSNTDFINKSGVWVTAKWENGKWIPENEQLTNLTTIRTVNSSTEGISFTISGIPDKCKLVYSIDYGENWKYTETANNEQTINFDDKDLSGNKTFRYFLIDPKGNMSNQKTKKIEKVKVENLLGERSNAILYGNSTAREDCLGYDNIKGYNKNHMYYASYMGKFNQKTTKATTQIFFPLVEWSMFGLNDNYTEGNVNFDLEKGITRRYEFIKNWKNNDYKSSMYDADYFRIDFNSNDPNESLEISEPMLVDISDTYGEGYEPISVATFQYTNNSSEQWIIK
ncbi:MAG: hypothetical protein ACI4UE_01755 [Candidatus Scatovivens sp.]